MSKILVEDIREQDTFERYYEAYHIYLTNDRFSISWALADSIAAIDIEDSIVEREAGLSTRL